MRTLLAGLLLLWPMAASSAEAVSDFDENILYITGVRDKLPPVTTIDPQINMQLLRLLQQRADARLDAQASLDAALQSLAKLTTVTGYKLQTRYTELGFLLTEGLAGVKDYQMQNELEKVVRQGSNVQTRAAALVALAYTKNPQFLPLIQGALNDPNITVRFAAVESLLLLDNPSSTQFLLANAARDDRSPAIRIYAAAGLWRGGDLTGRDILWRTYQDNDFFIRAMSTRYMGELGGADDYRKLMIQLSTETDPTVKAELCSALLRLQKFKS